MYNIIDKKLIYSQLVIPAIANRIGLEESLVLNQIYYWISKCGRTVADRDGTWIYNSIESWHKQFSYWSISKIRRILGSLESQGFIISKKVNARKWNQTKWYSIDEEKVGTLFKSIVPKGKKICSNTTTRFVQNEQIINGNTKNNYTKRSSYREQKADFTQNKIEEFFVNHEVELDLKKNPGPILSLNKKEYLEPVPSIRIPKSRQVISRKEQVLSAMDKVPSKVTDIACAMVMVWNEEFKYSLNPIKAYSTEKMAVRLYQLWSSTFDKNMERWRHYCRCVNSSQFLMGEKKTKSGFRAVFAWLVNEKTVEEILAGGYGVGDRELDRDNISNNIEKKKIEVSAKANKKIAECIAQKVSEFQEKEEFEEYVIKSIYLDDGDPYQMKRLFYNNSWLTKHGFLRDKEYEKLYKSTFESYITKKYIGLTKMEMMSELNGIMGAAPEVGEGRVLLERLKCIEHSLHRIELGGVEGQGATRLL